MQFAFVSVKKVIKFTNFLIFFSSLVSAWNVYLARDTLLVYVQRHSVCFYGQRINLIHKQTQKRPLYSRKLFERRKKQQWMKIKVLNSVQNGTTGTLKYIKKKRNVVTFIVWRKWLFVCLTSSLRFYYWHDFCVRCES